MSHESTISDVLVSAGCGPEVTPPETLKRRIDIFVAPATLECTMAFSHDELHGPYFARP